MQVRFGDKPKTRNEHEKYIFYVGTEYYIPDVYKVGDELIDKYAYNVQINSMFLDFAKFIDLDIQENK